jgi:hypothetical protein
VKPFAALVMAGGVGGTPGGGGGTPGGTTLVDGLVHWYGLEESTGARLDAVGTCDLTPSGGTPTAVTTPIGTGVSIPSGAFIAGSSGLAPLADSDFTIAGFFTGAGATTGIFARGGNTSNRQLWILTEGGNFIMTASTNGTSNAAVVSIAGVNPATPHFFFAWRDRTAGTINLQIDMGTPVSAALAGTASLYNVAGISQLIGALGTDGVYNGGTVGDDMGVWNRALTAEERELLYNGGAWRSFSEL